MDARGRSSASPASGSKRSRSPDNVVDAWRLKCKRSAAGSRRAACKFAGAYYMPEKLQDFAAGGRWYRQDPPLKPMSGAEFEAWRAEWERDRAAKAAWAVRIGSTSGGGGGGEEDAEAGEEEAEAAEEDAALLRALAESEVEAAEKARAEADEQAAAVAAVAEFQAKEAAARAEEEAAARAEEEEAAARYGFVPYIILE